jgi:hypothetical protein
MQKKKWFGLGLVILGLIILLIKPLSGLTGFVISTDFLLSFITIFYVLGLASLVVGTGLVLTTPREYQSATLEDYLDSAIVRAKIDEGQKPFVVLDSNFFIYNFQRDKTGKQRGMNYLEVTRYLQHLVEDKGYHVIIPKAVEEELILGSKNSKDQNKVKKIRRILREGIGTYNFSDFKDYEQLRQREAKGFIEESDKYQRGQFLVDFLNYERKSKTPLNRQNMMDRFFVYLSSFNKLDPRIKEELKEDFSQSLIRYRNWVSGKYHDDVDKKAELMDLNTPESIEILTEKIKKTYTEVDNDSDVLASALYGKLNSKHPVPTYLVSADEHVTGAFRRAIEQNPRLIGKAFLVDLRHENLRPYKRE